MVPSTATARRLATDATALLIPAAVPVWRAATAFSTVAVKGATVTAMPKPMISIGKKNVVQ